MPARCPAPGGSRVASYTAGMPSTSRPAGCQTSPAAESWPPNGTRAAGAASGGRGPVGRGTRAVAAERDGADGAPAPVSGLAVVHAVRPPIRQASSTRVAVRLGLRGARGLIMPKPYSQRRPAHVTYRASRLYIRDPNVGGERTT